MNEWLINSMVVASTTLTIAGASSVFMPGNSAVGIAGSALGGAGAAIATHQQNQRFKRQLRSNLRSQLEQELQEVLEQKLTFVTALNQQLSTLNQLVEQLQQQSLEIEPVSHDKASNLTSEPVVAETQEPVIDPELMNEAIAWFQTHHSEVKSYYEPRPETDAIFNRLASHLGKGYKSQNLEFLYKRIKGAMQRGGRLWLNLSDRDRSEIGHWTNFCSQLYRSSLFSSYRYSSADKVIQATIQQQPEMTQFLNGGWLERYVSETVLKSLRAKRLNYSSLSNPKVGFPTGEFELDLFFLVEGEPLWIECKTGRDYNRYLRSYSEHRKHLGIPSERAMLVILDISESDAENLTNLWGITVANLEGFEQRLPWNK